MASQDSTNVDDVARSVLNDTLLFAEQRFQKWAQSGMLPQEVCTDEATAIRAERDRSTVETPRPAGYLPLIEHETDSTRSFRHWKYLQYRIVHLKNSQAIPLTKFHQLYNAIDERLSAIERQLFTDGVDIQAWKQNLSEDQVSVGDGVPEETKEQPTHAPLRQGSETEAAESDAPKRQLMEILLDPNSIQWLLGLGAALMVLGLVILLWVNEFFTPPVMAVSLGLVNFGVFAAGFAILRYTRYQMAGKALTLLACLVMPLNLWYYSANDLVTIDGHLWVAAVIICVIYAVAAWRLKDNWFVYVFEAGVTLTGLLILADLPPSPQKFWQIPLPASLLVILGVLSIHVERFFTDDDGPFSRRRFGLAFFWSGHAQMAVGLCLIAAAQIAGDWLYELWFRPVFVAWGTTPSPICNESRWIALMLVGLSTYAYVYSDLVVRRVGSYIHAAALTLLWAEILLVQIFNLNMGIDAIIGLLAVTSLIIHILQATIAGGSRYTRSLPAFGLLLGLLPVVIGVVIFMQHVGPNEIWIQQVPKVSFVGAMLMTALASRVGAYVYQNVSRQFSLAYHFASGGSLMIATAACLAMFGGQRWDQHAPILMLIPMVYLLAAHFYDERASAQPLRWVAHAAAVIMLISSVSSAFAGFRPDGSPVLHLSLAVFFMQASVFYAIATRTQNLPQLVSVTTVMMIAGTWQFLTYFGVQTQVYIVVFALIGVVLLIAYRLSFWERTGAPQLAEPFFQSANAILSLAIISSLFKGLSDLSQGQQFIDGANGPLWNWTMVIFFGVMLLVSLVALGFVIQGGWRRWYLLTSLAQASVGLLTLHQLIDLTAVQQIELFAVTTGLILLVVGHIGWYRENERISDVVSLSLVAGSLLSVCPLAIATWIDRYHDRFLVVNEFGFLIVSVMLLATGLVFRLKATTIVGGFATIIYFVTLLIFVPWGQLNTVAVVITVGGGLIFAFGLTLAIFRDRLLTLPQRVSQRQGLFHVLGWR